MRDPGYTAHPLTALFHARNFTNTEGMNWLQDRGLISDNCVTVESVAPCDIERVLNMAAQALADTRGVKLPQSKP